MNLQVDLRDVSPDKIINALQELPSGVQVLLTAWQWSLWKKIGGDPHLGIRTTVMVPDFLHYARLAGTGQPREILRLPGSNLSVAAAATACAPAGIALLPGLATGQFWAAAEAMTRYDIALLGRSFSGEVILHYNLTDFACFFENVKFFRVFSKIAGWTSWGFATQQLPPLISICSRSSIIPQRLLFPTGINRPETCLIESARGRQFADTKISIDFTQWPSQVLSAPELYDIARSYDDTWLTSRAAADDLV